tara:strand:- start:282 stop:635 length:354 start_codon:yes stop_codon:yes gene_type:complete
MNPMRTAPDQVSTAELFSRLAATIKDRRNADPERSYVAKLCGGGTEAIAKKVGEEAVETVLAAVSEDRNALLRESADLVFHLMVLWAHSDIALDDVAAELARRERVSGLEEKRGRRN